MNTATITIETHNDGLRITERTLTIPTALAELQAKLDAGTFGGCFPLVEALLVVGRDDLAPFAGQSRLVRIPKRDGLKDSLIDRLEGVNRHIHYANARRPS